MGYKEDYIKRHGEEAYQRLLQRNRDYYEANKEERIKQIRDWQNVHKTRVTKQRNEFRKAHLVEHNTRCQKWAKKNPEKIKTHNQESCRPGGKWYKHRLEYNRTGLRGERNRVRDKHRRQYRPFKMIIAPDSQIHHEWVPSTAEYTGVALVEAKPHQYGIVDVIEILDGKITLLTEEQIKNKNKKSISNEEPTT